MLTNTQGSRLCKAFANNSSAIIKLLKTGLPLMKNVFKQLVKSVLIPLGLTASATENCYSKERFWIRYNKEFSNFQITERIKFANKSC